MKLIIILSLITYGSSLDVAKFKLNNGVSIPAVALGTGTGTGSGDELHQMFRNAVDVGFRHVDTAFVYRNEKQVGELVNEAISAGKFKRDEFYVTTKLNVGLSGRAPALAAVRQSLATMNLTYLDAMLIHFPLSAAENSETYAGLEDALNLGLVKSIGVSNFNETQLEALLKTAKITPTVNQIPSHPKASQSALVEYSQKHNITVSAYSPLGSGNVTLLDDTALVGIGKAHNKSSAQVILHWQIQKGVVVITKSTNKDRLLEDLQLFDFTLTDAEMKTIDALK